jgi:hypothetical protein
MEDIEEKRLRFNSNKLNYNSDEYKRYFHKKKLNSFLKG